MKFTELGYRTYQTALGGRLLQVEIGKVTTQANGSCTVRYGDTVVNVTACMAEKPRDNQDFFPLSCDYEERMYAAGKIPGGFIRREGRPSEKATLCARLMDRPLRPLFPKGFFNDVQVVATVMCVDTDCSPEVSAMIGSSIALSVSNIPFAGPTASVVMGLVDGKPVVNPTNAQREESKLSLTVSGTRDAIMMVEAGADEVPEDLILDALFAAHDEIKKIVSWIDEIVEAETKWLAEHKPERVEEADGKLTLKKFDVPGVHVSDRIMQTVRAAIIDDMKDAVRTKDKKEQEKKTKAAKNKARDAVVAKIFGDFPEKVAWAAEYEANRQAVEEGLGKELTWHKEDSVKKMFFKTIADADEAHEEILIDEFRSLILNEGIRPDGRRTDEVRPVYCETGFLPRTHGSGLFKRGETQVLSVATLAPLREAQMIDGIGDETEKRYMHHYNFPGYSVGETRRIGSPGRREIGHGALAERALIPVLPSEEEFPYAIRVVSDTLESNGSSSQASVCGSTMSLMDAGVPIKAPVSGVAMGLVSEMDADGKVIEGGKIAVLTDIQGLEDHYGDMDFKVAGTANGITALQMDIKLKGVPREVMQKAILQAKEGRAHILSVMLEEIPQPRETLSPYAPRIESIQIDPEDIGTVVGKGGKTINGIIAETGVKIDIDDTGLISIASSEPEGMEKAIKMIELLLKEPEIGEVYEGKVTGIKEFGAFVEILPGKEGLLHISEMDNKRVNRVEDVLNLGDTVQVQVKGIDEQKGKISLTRKPLL
ncbi:MAG: polyribonucleotide nucleotidyltransferase [Clostridiales Family XIII bacterium]|nr:polyribonucleotide nucleotidyltransferase [Clostridiales Family XIII bacterium]